MSGRFTRVLRDGNGVHRVTEDRVRSETGSVQMFRQEAACKETLSFVVF